MWKPNGFVLRSVVRSQVSASGWASTAGERLRSRYRRPFDRGQTAVEYLGIIAVVVAIVLAITGTDIGQTIFNAITDKITEVTGG